LRAHHPEVSTLTFVGCAGTGASLCGIAKALMQAGFDVRTVLVEPVGCDAKAGVFIGHKLEGMAFGVAPPLLDWRIVSKVERVSFEDVVAAQRELSRRRGFFIGNTSAACFHVAHRRSIGLPGHHKTLSLIYDHGLWYPSSPGKPGTSPSAPSGTGPR
jgi:cysteine synthase